MAAALAALTTALLTPWLRRRLLANGLVDHPGQRRSHQQVTPRGGGLAMAAGLLLGLVLVFPGWLAVLSLGLLVIGLCALGWLDDRHDLPVRWRLLAQLGIAGAMVLAAGGVADIALLHWTLSAPWLWSLLAVPAIVWLINLHNFMDGSDGLAATQGIFCGAGYAILFFMAGQPLWFAVALLLAAVCAGFLAWNRPPAAIFMGDSGSILLGGMIAWLALVGASSGAVGVWTSLVLCSVFATDATATLARRLMRKERWYTAHRQHAYQRLIIAGWSHAQVLLLYGLSKLVVVTLAVLVSLYRPELELWLALGVVGLLTFGWVYIQSALSGEPKHA
jgi:Fuc2NAc and GlcNAc transferase